MYIINLAKRYYRACVWNTSDAFMFFIANFLFLASLIGSIYEMRLIANGMVDLNRRLPFVIEFFLTVMGGIVIKILWCPAKPNELQPRSASYRGRL